MIALAENVLERFQGVRRSRSGWQALCPAHADKNPSLSIDVRGDRILVHCHAGCPTDDVLRAAGIDARELFLDSGDGESRIVAEYPYTDESGGLLFQVVRREPKSFRQRRPDGRGGWIRNVKGVRLVLYRLPEVLAAKSVLICEGEQDVGTARTLNLAATCNPGGVGKWRTEYSEMLRGKHVTIIADADEPGRKHAQNVAASLSGKAATVQLLELPGAKDLSEWVERGGTRSQLDAIIAQAAEWRPSALSERGGFKLTTLGDLLGEPEEKISWLLADKLPAGGISILSAKPKVGKSTLARCLALAVASGEPFLGCKTTQGPVIYLALEEKRSEVRGHFSSLGATGEEPIHVHCAAAPQDALPDLCRLVKEIKPALVVVDPLFKFVRVSDERAYAEMCRAIEPLLTLARETGTHVMLVHHSGKAERADAMDTILGTTAIFGGVDSALVLKRSGRYRTLQSSQRYGVDWAETTLEFDPETRALSLGVEKSEAEAERIGQQILDYLKANDEPRTRVEVEVHVEGRTSYKRAALKRLCATGQVVESGAGSKGNPLRYSLASQGAEKDFVDSCSRIYVGTREQESQNGPEARMNASDILVPTSTPDSILVPASQEHEEPFEEGEL